MQPSDMQVPPPADWQAFERHLYDLYQAEWGASVKLHGRTGQPQCGVDVYGQPGMPDLHEPGRQRTMIRHT